MTEQELRFVHTEDFSPFTINGSEVAWQDLMVAPFERFCNLARGVRFSNILKREGIFTVFDLASRSEKQLRSITNLNDTGIDSIKSELAKIGLQLAPDAVAGRGIHWVVAARLVQAGLTPKLAAELAASPKALEATVELANNSLQQRTGTSLLASDAVKVQENNLRDAYAKDHSPITIEGITYQWEVFLGLDIEVLAPLAGEYHTQIRNRLHHSNIRSVRGLLSCSKADLLSINNLGRKTLDLCIERLRGLGLRLVGPKALIDTPMTVRDRQVGLAVLLRLRPSEADLNPVLDRHFVSTGELLDTPEDHIETLLGEELSYRQYNLISALRKKVAGITSTAN